MAKRELVELKSDIYKSLDQLFYSKTLIDNGFDMHVTEKPILLSSELMAHYAHRYIAINNFFTQALNVLKDALREKTSSTVLDLLLGDAPAHISVDFHRSIMNSYPNKPLFYRTDDPAPGRSCEFQCPGSLWGEYAVLEDAYSVRGCYESNSIADRFADSLARMIKEDRPTVHHLFDNSSRPGGVLYFIQRTRPRLRYFGFDNEVKATDVRLVRSHSVYGLVAENYFKERLKKAAKGELLFDLPPNLLFDAKGSLALPFWSETAHYFSQESRNLICRTVPVLPDGIETEDGKKLSIEEFSRLPRKKRRFYLKYAGSDVSINWGSKAVYRLSNESEKSCQERLRNAANDFTQRRPWIIQEEVSVRERIACRLRDSQVDNGEKHMNLRGFYGPSGLIGLMILYREHFKVHGQPDTVATIAENLERS
jgi:hypothetical protein